MSSPDRNFIFNEEILPQTPDGISLPAPRGPVVPGGPATPGSPVAAAAAAAPSYPLDGPEQPSPSREELESFYSSVEGSSISRNLFPDDDDDEEAAAAAKEVEKLEKHFGKDSVDWFMEHYGAGWIDAIKRYHGYDSSKYGLVPIIVAAAPAGASGEKRKGERKRGGKSKKYKKKRTKKKSRRRTKKRRKKKTRKKRGGLTTPADKNNLLERGEIYFYKRPGSNWIFKGTYSGLVNDGNSQQFDNWSGSEKQGENIGRIGPETTYTEDISNIDEIWRFNPLTFFLSERISSFVGGKSRKKKGKTFKKKRKRRGKTRR